jgi:uncharacterized damage-inducible protein DinB
MENLILLFEYHSWSINRMLHYVEEQGGGLFNESVTSVFSSIGDTFEHIYWADQTWFNRIKGVEKSSSVGFENARDAILAFRQLHEAMLLFLKKEDLTRKVIYQNSIGNSYENSLSDVLTHIVNHGTYHKGNITAMLWSLGKKSLSTDYIVFIRENGI